MERQINFKGNNHHVFRYIPPGQFLMGSPENEKGRYENENQHEVVITKGYWLGQTTVTQELWQAVMGDNPSKFTENGKKRPVENVSWDDCQVFLSKINNLNNGFNFRLPTEAEWEYACRAGTTTPFSFGENITTDIVNYNGNYPYAGEKKGWHREKTVEVKSLPYSNNWGLYEMHGNVYEWCQDYYREYNPEDKIDPKGPEKGVLRVLRVLRGGGWVNGAGYTRSAARDGSRPSFHYSDIGLRLVFVPPRTR